MLSKNQLKVIKSLRTKKGRDTHSAFLVEGRKPVEELLQSDYTVKHLVLSETMAESYANKDAAIISDRDMASISAMTTPPGILAVANMPDWMSNKPPTPESGAHFVLDGIRDPGNLGTIIRTADWFGFEAIYCSQDCVECFNPKVVQASMGSVFRLKVFYANLNELLESSPLNAFGMYLEGKSIYKTDLVDGLYVIGSESHGIREEIGSAIKEKITIPGRTNAESLNAGISAAILMSEIFKRR